MRRIGTILVFSGGIKWNFAVGVPTEERVSWRPTGTTNEVQQGQPAGRAQRRTMKAQALGSSARRGAIPCRWRSPSLRHDAGQFRIHRRRHPRAPAEHAGPRHVSWTVGNVSGGAAGKGIKRLRRTMRTTMEFAGMNPESNAPVSGALICIPVGSCPSEPPQQDRFQVGSGGSSQPVRTVLAPESGAMGCVCAPAVLGDVG